MVDSPRTPCRHGSAAHRAGRLVILALPMLLVGACTAARTTTPTALGASPAGALLSAPAGPDVLTCVEAQMREQGYVIDEVDRTAGLVRASRRLAVEALGVRREATLLATLHPQGPRDVMLRLESREQLQSRAGRAEPQPASASVREDARLVLQACGIRP